MAANGNEDIKPEVNRAVAAGSDLSKGSDAAYNAMMSEVSMAQAKFGNDTAGFDKYGQAVAKGLEKSGTLEEMSERFAEHNIGKIANSDEKHVKQADLNPQFGTNALEKAFLGSLQGHYGDLQQRAGEKFFGGAKEQFGAKDFQHVLDSRQAERDSAEQARLAQDQAARENAKFGRVTTDLFKNDGNPSHSLYSVLDGIKSGDGHVDGKISHADLKRYEQDYSVRAARGDFGFNRENLDTVRTLDREWDGKLGVSLRGTSPRPGDSGEDQVNSTINMKAVAEALNRPVNEVFASYSGAPGAPGTPGSNGRYARVDAADPGVSGPSTLADNTGGAVPIPRNADGSLMRADASAQPGAQTQGYDAAAGQPTGVPQRRDVDASGRPVAQAGADTLPPGGAQRRAPGSAYDEYFGDGSSRGTAPQQGSMGSANDYAGGAPHRRQRDAALASQPGGDTAPSHFAAQPGRDAAGPAAHGATRRVEHQAAGADITNAPELKVPEAKPGDTPEKIAAAYKQVALDHFTALSKYTVQPGQGWDRIARDAVRKTGGDASNEHGVEALSDQIAKLNGASGRLDKSLVLHPNDVVKLHDDAWVQAQVAKAMQDFAAKGNDATRTSDATKPGGTTPAAADGPDLFSGARSGENTVGPVPGKDVAATAPKTDVPVAPKVATAPGANPGAATDNAGATPKVAATDTPPPGTNTGGVIDVSGPATNPAAEQARADASRAGQPTDAEKAAQAEAARRAAQPTSVASTDSASPPPPGVTTGATLDVSDPNTSFGNPLKGAG